MSRRPFGWSVLKCCVAGNRASNPPVLADAQKEGIALRAAKYSQSFALRDFSTLRRIGPSNLLAWIRFGQQIRAALVFPVKPKSRVRGR